MENLILKVNDLGLKNEVEKLYSKVKVIIEKLNEATIENKSFKEKVKALEQALSEAKIELSNKNSDLLIKDRELTDLKNKLLDEKKNRLSLEEKNLLKSRIRELMIRLDTHLEQKSNNNL
jgi:chromosome segregation ATPase